MTADVVRRRWPDLRLPAAFAFIGASAAALYLPAVFGLGFYYDDWLLQATFDDAASSSWRDLFAACRDVEPAGRPGGCVYHATVYKLLGDSPAAYHVLSIVLLAVSTFLLFLLLRRCRMPAWPALLVGLLYVVYPGSDSTRLWPTAVGAQYIIGAFFGGVLLGIAAIQAKGARKALLHAASLALFVLLAFTYEVVLALVAVSGAFYWLATRDLRRSLLRGGADMALSAVFIAYRLFVAPVHEDSGFVEARSSGAWAHRLRVVLEGGWHSWQSLFAPWAVTGIVVLVAVVVVATVAYRDPSARRLVLAWGAVAIGGLAFAALALLPYLPANDAYVPDPSSLFNRLNVAAAPAYCVVFVGLVMMLWHALRRLAHPALAAGAAAAMLLPTAVHQVDFAARSREAYAESWTASKKAVAGLERAAPQLPEDASVVTFGHPIWERGFIPVFAAGWDVRGAIDLRTHVDPPQAVPFVSSASCGPDSVIESGKRLIPYQGPSPLFFVNTTTAEARRIVDLAGCEKAVADWGRPPDWGRTVVPVPG